MNPHIDDKEARENAELKEAALKVIGLQTRIRDELYRHGFRHGKWGEVPYKIEWDAMTSGRIIMARVMVDGHCIATGSFTVGRQFKVEMRMSSWLREKTPEPVKPILPNVGPVDKDKALDDLLKVAHDNILTVLWRAGFCDGKYGHIPYFIKWEPSFDGTDKNGALLKAMIIADGRILATAFGRYDGAADLKIDMAGWLNPPSYTAGRLKIGPFIISPPKVEYKTLTVRRFPIFGRITEKQKIHAVMDECKMITDGIDKFNRRTP